MPKYEGKQSYSFLSIPEVDGKPWVEEGERRKKKVNENNGQLHFHGSRLDQFWAECEWQ